MSHTPPLLLLLLFAAAVPAAVVAAVAAGKKCGLWSELAFHPCLLVFGFSSPLSLLKFCSVVFN